jgi:hypothetical protein
LITWWYGKSPISSCSAISNTRTKTASKQGALGTGDSYHHVRVAWESRAASKRDAREIGDCYPCATLSY